MSLLNSSQVSLKQQSATSVSTLDDSGSSKNDISEFLLDPNWGVEKRPNVAQLITLTEIETDLMILNAKARFCIVNYDPNDDFIHELLTAYKNLGKKIRTVLYKRGYSLSFY